MSERYSERVPVVPPENHPYMLDLYGRHGLEVTAERTAVLGFAHHLWGNAQTARDRVGVAELLLGRRIDDGEVHSLPHDFTSHIFDGGEFGGILAAASQIIDADR